MSRLGSALTILLGLAGFVLCLFYASAESTAQSKVDRDLQIAAAQTVADGRLGDAAYPDDEVKPSPTGVSVKPASNEDAAVAVIADQALMSYYLTVETEAGIDQRWAIGGAGASVVVVLGGVRSINRGGPRVPQPRRQSSTEPSELHS